MAALEDFEHTLKEVVNAKRVSASKMGKLTEIAMKSLETDTKLVAILYRTHKTLPASAKVSSLYVFDALARAARSMVNKHGITGDINAQRGNAATFLLKIEGVLDGLFQDMASLDSSETKEKTKKVLDIWVKSNTFPSAVLARLRDILSDVRKENAVNPTISVDPSAATSAVIATSRPAPQTPTTTASDMKATLLALLGQAAQIQVSGHAEPPSQTTPNTEPQLQQAQLALLQQLALTTKLAKNSPTPPPGHTTPPTNTASVPPPEPLYPSSRPPQTADPRYTRNGPPDRSRDQRDLRGERIPRGGARSGFRGRGRRDDHSNHDRFRPRDRDWEPPPRPRRSRSRSPRRHEERRNVRTYSPPRRPSNDKNVYQPELPIPSSATPGKDEFGRDIRASSGSPSRSASVENTQAPAPMDSSVDPNPGSAPDNRIPISDQLPSVAASISAQNTETHTPSSATQQQPGLDQFDISTFDATAPSSWEALGSMWKASYGYLPSQEELMHFVITGSMAAAGLMNNGGFGGAQQGGQWQHGNWDEQEQRRNGEWRGGGNGGGNWVGHGGEQSDNYAVALNGDGEPSPNDYTDEQGKGGRG